MAALVASFFVLSTLPTIGGQATVDLQTADPFAILAGETVTDTGFSNISGDIGVHPGSAVTGFDEAKVHGEFHKADEVARIAKADLLAAYNDASGRSTNQTIGTELGGKTLLPGVYDSAAGTFGLTGELTLDADNDTDAVWIFQIASTLTTAVDSSVLLTNGAQACNVFWQVGSSATINGGTDLKGTILAQASVSVNDGATLDGRALALDGAVTLINTVISISSCEDPPGEDPPGEDPPGEDPPGEDPPGEDPPGEEPPGEDPPGEDPPGEDPPGEDPPGEDPPGEDPPMVCSTSLVASANADTSITLTWSPVAGADQYHVYRASGDEPSAIHGDVDGNTTSFVDADTEVGTMFSYEVRPVVSGVELRGCDVSGVTAIPVFASLVAAAAAAVLGIGAYVFARRRN